MKIHPVFILVMIIAMSSAFGIMGAFIATPLTAFIKAYYETFYRKEVEKEKHDKNIDRMLYRKWALLKFKVDKQPSKILAIILNAVI